jgi:hypothetical protein
MGLKYERANSWSNVVIGSAIEVHRLKGPGLLESIYEKCLGRELQLREVPSLGQVEIEIEYKGIKFSSVLQLDPDRSGRPKGKEQRKVSLAEETKEDQLEPQFLIGLCFLCYLLFKFSSILL